MTLETKEHQEPLPATHTEEKYLLLMKLSHRDASVSSYWEMHDSVEDALRAREQYHKDGEWSGSKVLEGYVVRVEKVRFS